MFKIFRFITSDLLKNWMIWLYTLFLLIFTCGFFALDSHSGKALAGILNVVLLVVPLFSIIFSGIYFYNSGDFIEFLLAQPIKRKDIIYSVYLGMSLVLSLSCFVGIGLPLIFMGLGLGFRIYLDIWIFVIIIMNFIYFV
jgi:Cu-processing system permease protein